MITPIRSTGLRRCSWPALIVLACALGSFRAGAQQTVTLQPEFPRVVVGANFTTATNYFASIRATLGNTNDPVTFVASGAPAGATLSISPSPVTNTAVVFLRVNIAGVAAGVYPLTVEAQTNGVTAASTTVDLVAGTLWSSASLAAVNWSTPGNWITGVSPGAGTDVKFEDAGVVTNVVDASVEIGSLTYARSATGNSNHTTRIANGQTLSVLGTRGLSINVESTNGNNKATTVNFTGTGATLFVSNTAAPFTVNALNNGNTGTTVVMSNLSTFVADVNRFSIGDVSLVQNGGAAQQLVTVRLARTNFIRAAHAGNYNELTSVNSITFFDNTDRYNNGSANTVEFGAANTFQADSFAVARTAVGSANNIVRFGPAFLSPAPTASFRNVGGSRMTLFTAGVPNGTQNVGANSRGNLDFRGGVLDLFAGTLILGANRSNFVFTGTGTPNTLGQGSLFFNAGTVDVNTARLGYQRFTNDAYAQGTIAVGGTGVLVANNEIELGYTSGGSGSLVPVDSVIAQGFGQLIVTNGGTVRANRITAGRSSLNNSITLTGGTLILSNNLASQDLRLATLTMSGNGKLVLPVITTGFTNAHVKSLLASAGIIEIQSVPGPGVYPLISYESAAPTLSLILPSGFYGIVKDNTANKTIDALISTNPPKTVVWMGNVNGTWNTTTPNWVRAGTSIATNFDDGDFVIFNDSATGTTSVTISGSVFPGQSPLTPGTTVSNNNFAYTITGGAISGTGRTLKLGSALLFWGGTHNTSLIVSNGGLQTSGGAVLNGGLTFAGTGGTNGGTINGPVSFLSGYFVNNNTISTAPGVLTTGSNAVVVNAASGTINAGGGAWSVVAGATLWNYGLINNLLGRLNVPGTLAGPGIIADVDFGGPIDGRVTIQNGGVISPGASIGTMEIQGRLDIELGSRAIIEVDYNHGSVNDRMTVDTMGSINGTFVMTNIGAVPFDIGRSNIVISGNFGIVITNANVAHIPVVSPGAPGVGKQWDVSLMRITNAVRAIRIVSVPSTPPVVTNLFQGTTNILMSWATTNLGFQVQQQTNNLSLGVSTNAVDWAGIPGTELTNRFNINPLTNPAGFYRLSNQ